MTFRHPPGYEQWHARLVAIEAWQQAWRDYALALPRGDGLPRCVCGYPEKYHGPAHDGCKTFRLAPVTEAVPYAERVRRDAAAREEKIAAANRSYVPEVIPPPRVRPRPPQGPGEFARGQGRQALGLGRKAINAGWRVHALYWQVWDGAEACGVWLTGPSGERAVAVWRRAPGSEGALSGWGADVAYAWPSGAAPRKTTLTALETFFTN